MKTTNYSQRIYASVEAVKPLIVAQIKRERIRQNLTPETLDVIVELSAEYPTFRELENNTNLFHPEILQAINGAALEHDRFNFCCSCLDEAIETYLSDPAVLEKVLREFHTANEYIHVTCWPENEQARDKFLLKAIEAIYEDRPIHWPGGVNSITPRQYAMMHVFLCIMKELE